MLLSLLAFSQRKLYWKGMNEVTLKKRINFEGGSVR